MQRNRNSVSYFYKNSVSFTKFKNEKSYEYSNVLHMLKLILLAPTTNAISERSFSTLTDKRLSRFFNSKHLQGRIRQN